MYLVFDNAPAYRQKGTSWNTSNPGLSRKVLTDVYLSVIVLFQVEPLTAVLSVATPTFSRASGSGAVRWREWSHTTAVPGGEISGPEGKKRYFGNYRYRSSTHVRLAMSTASSFSGRILSETSTQSSPRNNAISCDIPTACKLSGISRSYLYLVLARGEVVSVKAGRRRLVLVDSLRAWLQSLPTDGLAVSPTPAKGK
jgi:hypothetical protein